MTEESQAEQNPEQSVEAENINENESISDSGTDWFLQTIVNAANQGGLSFGITLTVGGILISGLLISGKEYFEQFAQSFESAGGDQEIASVFRSLGDTVYSEKAEDGKPGSPSYVHLNKVRFYSAGFGKPVPSEGFALWRGRIEAVDGFFLGVFHGTKTNAEENEDSEAEDE